MIDAALRQGDVERASQLATAALASGPSDGALTRRVAACHLAGSRPAPAITLLDAHLEREPGDLDAQWLRLHAQFMDLVATGMPKAEASTRDAFKLHAARYVEAKGRHAMLATEWASVVP